MHGAHFVNTTLHCEKEGNGRKPQLWQLDDDTTRGIAFLVLIRARDRVAASGGEEDLLDFSSACSCQLSTRIFDSYLPPPVEDESMDG